LEQQFPQFAAFGMMDVGLHRSALEDAFFISEEEGLFIVSDGVGGAVAGGLASTITVRTLPIKLSETCGKLSYTDENESFVKANALGHAVDDVRNLLLEKTQHYPSVKGLGATVVAGYYAGKGMMAFTHLGDSRAYLLRDGILERLTEDHTVADTLYKTGRISREQLLKHPDRHILTRYIGMRECTETEVFLLQLKSNDRLLFCTDGLTGMVSERTIGTLLLNNDSREKVVAMLITAANNAGGHDNITAVVVDVLPWSSRQGQYTLVEIRDEIGYSLLKTERKLSELCGSLQNE